MYAFLNSERKKNMEWSNDIVTNIGDRIYFLFLTFQFFIIFGLFYSFILILKIVSDLKNYQKLYKIILVHFWFFYGLTFYFLINLNIIDIFLNIFHSLNIFKPINVYNIILFCDYFLAVLGWFLLVMDLLTSLDPWCWV